MTADVHALGIVGQWTMGDRIRKARRSVKGLTMEDLAAALTRAGVEVSKAAVGHWESNANDIDEDKRAMVAAVVSSLTGYDARWLLEGDSYGSPTSGPALNSGWKTPHTATLLRLPAKTCTTLTRTAA